jgi:tripartite-type tricarboxylate transporter receptor subunit TctC
MRRTRRQILISTTAVLAAAMLPAGISPSWAQDTFPSKTITLIVPAAAGGPTDTVSRLIAESMTKTLGQTVIVENAGGAGGTIGMAKLKSAAPTGYTIGIWHISHATAPALYDNLTYKAVEDFDHIGRVTDVPMTIVSKAALPAKDIGELVTWIKGNKEKVTYGHAGIGSGSHLCTMLLESALKVEMLGVGYKGTGPAMNDLLGGQFEIMCDQTTNTTNQIKTGKIKGFAVTTKTKVSSVPELPTLDSTAIKDFDLSIWHAMWAPKGLPKDVTDKLVAALQTALKDPKVIERFAGLGTEPVSADMATPAALKTHLIAELAKWGAVIKAAGVKAN